MKENEFKELLKKYEKGQTTAEENALLEKFETHFLNKHSATTFISELHKKQVEDNIYKTVKRNLGSSTTNWYKIVASLIVLVGVGVSAWFAINPIENVQYNTITTAENELKTIVLNDSSVITLNENSRLKFPTKFAENQREVSLDGEAYFKISKDKNRPFIVTANEVRTKVLGTEFNIKMQTEAVSVALVEGSVDVCGLATSKILKPNEKINFNLKEKKVNTETFKVKEELLWMKNKFVFSNTSMLEVKQLLEQKFGVTIQFENPEINTIKVSGTFTNQSVSAILVSITKATDLSFKKLSENQILIYKPKKIHNP
ncbi:FecR family protein [Joostella sp. CR20]|uniref:FecR family protein n=1 Tax=Joostella sp. CR20 TaxID=2804312 RepID=UPI00313E5CBA